MTTERIARPLAWPDDRHTLVLRAALLEGAPALEAWERWRVGTNFADLDAGTYRLLPLLQRNLTALGVQHPEEQRWRGVQRLTWARNQTRMAHIEKLTGQFVAAGVNDLMLLKGLPLALTYYRDIAARPMQDVDLLVRPADLAVVRQVLIDNQWTCAYPEFGPFHNELLYVHADGSNLDLHWRSQDHLTEADDEALWSSARHLAIGKASILAPSPVHLLLHILVHGARFNVVPPIRWAADATILLREAPLDEAAWQYLVAWTIGSHQVLPVRETLAFVRQALAFEVPDWVGQQLDRAPVARRERIRYALDWSPPEVNPGGGILRLLINQSFNEGINLGHVRDLFRHYTATWSQPNGKQFSKTLLSTIVRRLRLLPRSLQVLSERWKDIKRSF